MSNPISHDEKVSPNNGKENAMPLSCTEISKRLDLMRDSGPASLAQRGMGFSYESDVLNMIESLNAHQVLIVNAIRQMSARVPGSISMRTLGELQQMMGGR